VIRDSEKNHVAATRDELSKLNIIGRRQQRNNLLPRVNSPKFSSSYFDTFFCCYSHLFLDQFNDDEKK